MEIRWGTMTLPSFNVLRVTLIFAIPSTPAQGCDVVFYLLHWSLEDFFVGGGKGFRDFCRAFPITVALTV